MREFIIEKKKIFQEDFVAVASFLLKHHNSLWNDLISKFLVIKFLHSKLYLLDPQWVRLRKFPSTEKDYHLFFSIEKISIFFPSCFLFPSEDSHQNFLLGFFHLFRFPIKISFQVFFTFFNFPSKFPSKNFFHLSQISILEDCHGV